MDLQRMKGLPAKEETVGSITGDSVNLRISGQTDGYQGVCPVSWRVRYQHFQLFVDLSVLPLHHIGVVEIGNTFLERNLPLLSNSLQN